MKGRQGLVLAAVLILAASGNVYGDDCRDRDGDGDFDLDDLIVIKNGFGRTFPPCTGGDLNGDGKCDLYDLASIRDWFGSGAAYYECLDLPVPAPPYCGCPDLPGPAPLGPMQLCIDATGEAFLSNPTGEDIPFCGYQITSASGQLDIAAWDSIASDPMGAALGPDLSGSILDLFGFCNLSYLGEAAAEFSILAEVGLLPNRAFSLGEIVADLTPSDLEFLYAAYSAPDGVYRGLIVSALNPPGDADLDGDVDLDDFTALKNGFGVRATWAEGDFDRDGDVDLDDFTVMKNYFGAGAVPEPATLALLALGGLAVIRRK